MKIKKRKDLHRVKIVHNTGVLWVIIILFVLLGFLIYAKSNLIEENVVCVPDSCCHPSGCVPLGEEQDCDSVFCTQECAPGTLDCGQGTCEYINKECVAVIE